MRFSGALSGGSIYRQCDLCGKVDRQEQDFSPFLRKRLTALPILVDHHGRRISFWRVQLRGRGIPIGLVWSCYHLGSFRGGDDLDLKLVGRLTGGMARRGGTAN